MKFKLFTYLILLLSSFLIARAQVRLTPIFSNPQEVVLPVEFPKQAKEVELVQKVLEKWVQQMRKKGYLEISIDNIEEKSTSHFIVNCFLGKKYSAIEIYNGNIKEDLYPSSGIGRRAKRQITFNEVEDNLDVTYTNYANNGYPMAEVYLDSIHIGEGKITAQVFVKQNEYVLYESLIIHGDTKSTNVWLQQYLGITFGEPYSQQKIDKIPQRIEQLAYLQMVQPTEVSISNGKATVNIYLNQRRANTFDFLLGFLPNNDLSNRKLTITGDGQLRLLHSFGMGEEISVSFQQLKPRTQDLEIAYSMPYIHTFPLGLEGQVGLYKNDSMFFNLEANAGLVYQFGGVNQFRGYYENHTSNILNYDTGSIVESLDLPDELDVRSNHYGFGLDVQRLDYPINPREGYYIKSKVSLGTRKIKENGIITNLKDMEGNSLDYLYNQISNKQLQLRLGLSLNYFIPVKKRSVFLLKNEFEALIAKNILENESYRVGGFSLLRGFDEEALVSPFYNVSTFEYRFMLSQNSYFHTFVDVGVVESNEILNKNWQVPFGFGTGVSLETKGGIFSLSYALGKLPNNKMEVRNGKIHFGYVNLF